MTEHTYSAFTTLPGKAAADALAAVVENMIPEPYGIGVFEIEDGSGLWEVGAYYTEKPDDIALSLFAAAHDAKPFVISEIPPTDWVAEVRRELAPVRAGRFLVYGSHDADKLTDDVIPLLIEAAMAFGTGHHGTTQGCLTALDKLAVDGFEAKNTIDVGCGTAVLAMGAAHLWDTPIIASDIDEVATDTTRANIASNNLTGRIDVVTCAGFDDPAIHAKAPFDLILANILKGPLVALAPDMARMAAPGCYVILSGLLNEQADEVIAAYAENGFDLVDHLQITDWSTLTLRAKT